MMQPDMMQRNTGFTLLELLVSLSIFALIGVMAYGGLQSVMIQQSRTEEASQRLADLQKAYRIMRRDLEQIVVRKIRNEFGDTVDELVGGSGFTGSSAAPAIRTRPVSCAATCSGSPMCRIRIPCCARPGGFWTVHRTASRMNRCWLKISAAFPCAF